MLSFNVVTAGRPSIVIVYRAHARQHHTTALLDDGRFHERPKDEDDQRRCRRYEEKQTEQQPIHDCSDQLPLLGDTTTNVVVVVFVVISAGSVFLLWHDDLEVASNWRVIGTSWSGYPSVCIWSIIGGCSCLVVVASWPPSRLNTLTYY